MTPRDGRDTRNVELPRRVRGTSAATGFVVLFVPILVTEILDLLVGQEGDEDGENQESSGPHQKFLRRVQQCEKNCEYSQTGDADSLRPPPNRAAPHRWMNPILHRASLPTGAWVPNPYARFGQIETRRIPLIWRELQSSDCRRGTGPSDSRLAVGQQSGVGPCRARAQKCHTPMAEFSYGSHGRFTAV